MIEIPQPFPKTALAGVIVACAVIGAALSVWPVSTSAVLLVVIAFSVLVRLPKFLLIAFLIFLIAQDPLQVMVGGDLTDAGLFIKRIDEPWVLLYGAGCLLFSTTVQRGIFYRRIGIAIALCYLGLFLSSIPPISGWIPAAIDFALFSKPLALFAIGLSIAMSDREVDRAARPIIFTMLAIVAFGVVFLLAPALQDAYIGGVRAPDERLGFLSAQGFFIGPGTYSWFAAATFAIGYAAYLAYAKLQYLVASFVAAGFVILSWRRKSILAILAVLLISLIVRTTRGGRARALLVVAVSLAIVATLLAPYVAGLWQNTVKEYGPDSPAQSARSALYFTSLSIASDRFPLGLGFASFGSHASKLYYSEAYQRYGLSEIWGLSPTNPEFITDTYWPMILGEGGVLSLAGTVVFFALLLVASWRMARRPDRSATDSFVALASLFLLVGSLFESTASHIYGSSLQAALVLIPAGILWQRTRLYDLARTARAG